MRMRNDMCVDSFVLRMFEKQTIDYEEEEEGGKPPSLPASSSLVSPEAASANVETTEERSGNSAASSLSPQKESLLVQINNRVKLLEKNATTAGSFLRQLNASLVNQAADMDHILEAVIRAKETFKDSLSEQVTVRSRLKLLTERLQHFEVLVEESSQTVKLLMATLIMMAVSGLYLVCSLLGRSAFEVRSDRPFGKKEVGTMTESVPAVSAAGSLKKVVFRTPPNMLADMDASLPCRGRSRPKRRVTWCGGGGGEGRAVIVDDSAALRQHEELKLEDEILKSILKKAAGRAPSLDTLAAGAELAAGRRRVTWCGGYLSRNSDQFNGKAREI